MNKPYIDMSGNEVALIDGNGEIITFWTKEFIKSDPELAIQIIDIARNLADPDALELALIEYGILE